MFYQHNPDGDTWGNIHWGHIRSRNLITWEDLPVALRPSPERDEIHCFSGCAVLDGAEPVILYTSVGEGNRDSRTGAEQYLARSADHMETWVKDPVPVLTNAIHDDSSRLGSRGIPNEQILEWRDPFVWQEDGEWHLLLGGSRNGYGCILLYRSTDLVNWRFINTLFENRDYPFLECPNLLRYGERSVLLYSPNIDVRYHTGFIDVDGRFITEKSGTLDYSSGKQGFYAPNTLLNDPAGRYITWGWITEQSRNGYPLQGYNGALSLPRILSLTADNNLADSSQLIQTPAEEINAFLSEPIEQIALSLSGGERELKTRGAAVEIRLSAFLEKGDDFSLNVYKSPDGRECTRIHYDHEKRELTLEKGLSSLDGNPSKDFQRAKLSAIDKNSKRLDLRIFLDHSIIEIFANDEAVITGRVYPVLQDSLGMSLSGRAAQVTITIRRVQI